MHYVGHSDFTDEGNGVLFLEDENGSAVSVDETLFANLLGDQGSLRLVVLNSCEGARTTMTDPYAGVATTLVHLGVPAVVAMQFEISDEAAILFAEELYTNLIGRQDPLDVGDRRSPQGDLRRGRPGRVGDARAVPAPTPTSSCSASRSTPRRSPSQNRPGCHPPHRARS